MNRSPMRTTIVFGLVCGLAFVPGLYLFRGLFGGFLAFRLLVWLFLAGYGVFLTGWGEAKRSALLFPLGMAVALAFIAPTRGIFFLLSLATLAWIRSGISFPGRPFPKVALELLLTLAGGWLVMAFAPLTPLQWALGIWLFFVIQSLYFARGQRAEEADEGDAFETARREAERILSGAP